MRALLVAHGSPDPRARALALGLRKGLERALGVEVLLGFIEHQPPALLEAALELGARGGGVVLPLLLLGGGHLKADLPLALEAARARYPGSPLLLARPLGTHPALVALWAERLWRRGAGPEDGAVLVLRGGTDPGANAEGAALARLIEERAGLPVVPAYAAKARPTPREALLRLAALRPRRVFLLPHLFFRGVVEERLLARVEGLDLEVLPPLMGHPALLQALSDRYREALEGGYAPCDTCRFRFPIGRYAPRREAQIAGLRALRHALFAPGRHPHGPFTHLLLCTGEACREGGSLPLLRALEEALRPFGPQVQLTPTPCLGRCGKGPLLIAYPEGVVYGGLGPEDLPGLLRTHLEGGEVYREKLLEVI
ncbi:CbiX/SirB N-terminal domain-containing protein [Thermus filiformis]|uniref:Cobalamin biosynthesis protein CbiX n=1 Tax=Thermus filiformis TaxID=276 RepID=A0A0A2X958_THEFI|nr:CbiX/SirB N-terminal domain-containing protein [Thermus filiformis]KGQ21694.2 cobalamin biosynthesis protein CbiX [Thermus filiformis]